MAASGIDESLILNPKPVVPVTFSDSRPGEPGLWGCTDFHALYPIDGKTLMRSLSDLDSQAGFCPHVTYSAGLQQIPGDPFFQRHLQQLTFDYLFFKLELRHEMQNYIGTAEDGIGLYLDFRLSRTFYGGLAYSAGSWYLRPMTVGGRQYTYVRFYFVNCVQGLPEIVKFAMRTFPGLETPATMNAFYKHATVLRDAEGVP